MPGCERVGKRTGHALGARSVVATSVRPRRARRPRRPSEDGGGGGRFGAKARSARATERSVRTVRVREGAGGDRSRARAGRRRTGEERGDGAAGEAVSEVGGAERPEGPRGRGEIDPCLGFRIPIYPARGSGFF